MSSDPIALVARDPRRGQRVVACCSRAASAGIKLDMPGSAAASLIESATNGKVTTTAHDPQADLDALQELAAACTERFSPIVAFEPQGERPWAGQMLHAPAGLLMDVTGIAPLFGDEESLCREVEAFFHSRRLRVGIALADTIAAAWGLSRTTFQSRRATGTASFCITDPEFEFHHLQSLPTVAMRLEPRCVQTLARLGIEQFGQLLRLPREGLATRFGSELILRIDQLLGNVNEPFPAYQTPPENNVSMDLEYPTHDRDVLELALERLAKRLSDSLTNRGHGALRIVCQLDFVGGETVGMRLGLFSPTAQASHLLALLQGNLQRKRLSADVHRVALTATLTGPLQQRQPELIDDAHRSRCNSQPLANLIDNLSGRLGRESVLGIQSSRSPLPEAAFKLQPLTGQPIGEMASQHRRPNRTTRPTRQVPLAFDTVTQETCNRLLPSSADPLRRPLQLLPQPVPLCVLEIERTSPPQVFQYRGTKRLKMLRHWGPERIETAWWRGPTIARDYYRIETDQGDWLWIFRRLNTNDWYLHGVFA